MQASLAILVSPAFSTIRGYCGRSSAAQRLAHQQQRPNPTPPDA
jgi:hypothetical protein